VCVCECFGPKYKMQNAAQFQQVEDIFYYSFYALGAFELMLRCFRFLLLLFCVYIERWFCAFFVFYFFAQKKNIRSYFNLTSINFAHCQSFGISVYINYYLFICVLITNNSLGCSTLIYGLIIVVLKSIIVRTFKYMATLVSLPKLSLSLFNCLQALDHAMMRSSFTTLAAFEAFATMAAAQE